jgi:Mat/Ecp fimbriae major subunit
VAGSNRATVVINAPNVTLVNQSDPSRTLTLVLDSPATVTLSNSGSPGIDFAIGGAITLDSITASGQYSGTFEVTAEYQ